MKRCELLSPAGSMEMLKYAIMYGADAVYLAGTKYGARKYAQNFTDEELKMTVNFAHLYDVKVYITINTLVYEREVDEFIENVKFLSEIGIDAVLVQDFGMLNAIRQVVPELEVHASTQMHNNGKEMLELLKSLGVKRAVLDRELSLEEIKNTPLDIEKEFFCHGARCVSYSGQCLFSSRLLNRSGNRGECAGLCRLPYKKKTNGVLENSPKYYFSLKDFCTLSCIDKLIESGISSLKIEGRMKSPEYVGYITKVYREAIDAYYEGRKFDIDESTMRNVKILFNRGLSAGFLFDKNDEETVNAESPNHIGVHLGTYVPQKDKILLKLDDELLQGDTIRFQDAKKGMTVNFLYDETGKLKSYRGKGEPAYVDNFLNIDHPGELRLVASSKLNGEIGDLPEKKIPIEIEIYIKKDSPVRLCASSGEKKVEIKKDIPSLAKTAPIKKEDVEKQISKVGSTVYSIASLKIDLDDGLFLGLKLLNEWRRELLQKLDSERTKRMPLRTFDLEHQNIETTTLKPALIVTVWTKEQYLVAKKYTSDIYTANSLLLKSLPEGSIYPKYVDSKFEKTSSKYMISDYGALLNIARNDDVCSDYMLNVTNSYTANNILLFGINAVYLSVEMTLSDIASLASKVDLKRTGVLLYGKVELMKMKYDPRTLKDDSFIDREGREYKIKTVGNFNYLMGSLVDNIANLGELLKLKIGQYRVDFFDEEPESCEKILSEIHKYF